MKRLIAVLGIATLLVSHPAHAAEVLAGTITATTTKNNADTAVPFYIGGVHRILVQCDVAAYLVLGTAKTVTATANTGLLVDAGEKWETATTGENIWLAVLPVAGTANCKVFRVQ